MKIHNCGKFHLYSICGCQVINFQMFSWQYSIHELGHFVGIWALTAPNIVQSCLNLHQRQYSRRGRQCFKNLWEIQSFMEAGCYQSVHFFFSFCPTLTPFYPMKQADIKKTNIFGDKIQPLGYPNIAISRPYLVSIFQEKYDYFLLYFGCFLLKKEVWSHFERSQSKFHIAYFTNMIPGHVSVFCSSTCQFCCYRSQRLCFFNFNPLFKVWLLSRYPGDNTGI